MDNLVENSPHASLNKTQMIPVTREFVAFILATP